jgi:radical SAM superfamily enzyme YgiQ (UPF0313 family)
MKQEYTREEIYSQIYHHEQIFPPPLEQGSVFLEVMSGCRYGKCNFCDFRRDKLEVYELEDLERQLQLLKLLVDGRSRMHFLGCNPFFLDTETLLYICALAARYLPGIRAFNMYSRADDINAKTDRDLFLLRQAGITELHVGLESGSDAVLAFHNKGETADEIETALKRLEQADIRYHLTMIPGLGGKTFSKEHEEKTAALLSRLHPDTIWCFALILWENVPLHARIENGEFEPLTPLEILEEERRMMEKTEMERACRFIDSTVLKKYTLQTILPEGKAKLLAAMDQLIAVETAGYDLRG